jgi:hypothetical protein
MLQDCANGLILKSSVASISLFAGFFPVYIIDVIYVEPGIIIVCLATYIFDGVL